jgi:hypothetical protein
LALWEPLQRDFILKWILGATPKALAPSLEPSIRTVGMSPCRDQLRRGFLLYVTGEHSNRALAFPEFAGADLEGYGEREIERLTRKAADR